MPSGLLVGGSIYSWHKSRQHKQMFSQEWPARNLDPKNRSVPLSDVIAILVSKPLQGRSTVILWHPRDMPQRPKTAYLNFIGDVPKPHKAICLNLIRRYESTSCENMPQQHTAICLNPIGRCASNSRGNKPQPHKAICLKPISDVPQRHEVISLNILKRYASTSYMRPLASTSN